jgi:hypothetical protein
MRTHSARKLDVSWRKLAPPLGLVLGGLAILLTGGGGSRANAATTPPTFGQPTISGVQGFGFEENIRLDPTAPNRVYTSVPDSGGSNTSWIWHSEDAGRTFKWVPAAQPTQGKVISCPGGGDTELAVDTTGHLYFADLHLDNFSTARSDDHGTSFTCNPAGVPDAIVDRQWYATDGDPTSGGNLFLASNQIGQGQPVCGGSNEGNNVLVVYRSPPVTGAGAAAGLEFAPAYKVTAEGSCDEGIMGNVEVSPKTHHIFVPHDNAFLDSTAVARCVTVAFGVPLPGVSDPSGLNCTDIPVASFPGYKTAGNFPNMAIDKNGNLYVVWEQAPIEDGTGYVIGDTVLKYSFSTNDGSTWSTPITIPTPGLHNNVYAWPAAGDDGRVDIAWYGTPNRANDGTVGQSDGDPTCGRNGFPAGSGSTGTALGGPDAVTNGIWSVYMVQTLNGHAGTPTFTAPIQAGEHYVHKGSIQTIIGGLCGNRALGDFLQMRVGSKGEAQIVFGDSNSLPGSISTPHAMYIRQNGGTGLYGNTSPVVGDPILLNGATDPSGDGRLEAGGTTSDSFPNLDILDSSMSKPVSDCRSSAPCYRVKMTINDLSLEVPAGLPSSDGAVKWLTQWLVPAAPDCVIPNGSVQSACATGGKNFFVYAEWDGQSATCWSGETAAQQSPGPTTTYPGLRQLPSSACSIVTGQNGTITIDVPISDVSLPDAAPFSDTLYSVTASTMSLAQPDELPPPFAGVGGIPFNLIDVVRAYDANFTPPPTPTLTLAPKTATNTAGARACFTATLKNASGAPIAGASVRFKATGANNASATKTTNTSGQATFCYEGKKVGTDTIKAFADLNKNKTQDAAEPGDTATATWNPSS